MATSSAEVMRRVMAWWLVRWITNRGVPASKPIGGSKVDPAVYLSEVEEVSTRNSWGLGG